MDIRECQLLDNARAGALFNGAKAGTFCSDFVSGNRWALVLQDSILAWKGCGNDLADNEHPGKSNPGLVVPEPPHLSPEDLTSLKLPSGSGGE
jgi:hypothetical protein